MSDTNAPSYRIYLAGPLFSDAERSFNLFLKKELENAGFSVFLPQEDAEDTTDERNEGGLSSIFSRCSEGVASSDLIVAVLDGADVDSGTAWEIGYAYALQKPVIGLRTDFRICGAKEDVNLMILKSLSGYAGSVSGLIEEVCRVRDSLRE
ncbi:nucleoside 2-deoxyribosyltransferase [Methanosarcinaceae archaeon]|nr:nucleoside 2-deoxyribosyltransferase [Methanosarcinaceae archaeon]MBQ3620320.1 nucleoside 2-deoxyribosyltransferase [Methanosarcinaceae archaeon]